MLEKDRQIVVFGNFNAITFNELLKINEIAKKYELIINAQPDIVAPDQVQNNHQPIVLQQNQISVRPVLNSKDGRLMVFLGSSRIHVEQQNSESNSFEDFKCMSLDIINTILSLFEVSVNRVALNGKFSCENKEKIIEQFNFAFNKSELFNESSKEWEFRINTTEKNPSIGCDVNKIISSFCYSNILNEGNINFNFEKNYDYNTRIENNRIFSIEEINLFIEDAATYREKVLKELE